MGGCKPGAEGRALHVCQVVSIPTRGVDRTLELAPADHEDRYQCNGVVVHHEHQRGAADHRGCCDVEGGLVVQSRVGAANLTE